MTPNVMNAILACKCPQCRQGSVFKHSSLSFSKFSENNDYCPVCGLRFEREPGFFTGAMYVGYAISVAIIITVFTALMILGDPPLWVYISLAIGLTFVSIPINYRYSRVLYLYWFGDVPFRSQSSEYQK